MTTNQVWTEIEILNLISLTKTKEWIKENWNYDVDNKDNSLPFINYVLEDKSLYPKAKDSINPKTNKEWVDLDNDFLIGNSGGLLMNIDFIFVDTYLFTKAADFYTKHGEYCLAESTSIEYKKFWGRETHRRKAGITAKCKLPLSNILEYFNPKTTAARKSQLVKLLVRTLDILSNASLYGKAVFNSRCSV